MSAAAQTEQPVAKSSKKGLIIGLILALLGGGGGFFVTYSGIASSLLGGGGSDATASTDTLGQTGTSSGPEEADARRQSGGNTGFVALEPITISLGPRGQSRHLRFAAQLEVPRQHASDVQHLMPRIMDVLNIYLRALDPHEIEEPAALLRLRAQMLRRVQIVTGPGFVNDLLVMEFVLN